MKAWGKPSVRTKYTRMHKNTSTHPENFSANVGNPILLKGLPASTLRVEGNSHGLRMCVTGFRTKVESINELTFDQVGNRAGTTVFHNELKV